jgi:hypothetical protein
MDVRPALELTHAAAAVAAFTRLVQLKLNRKFPALLAYLGFLAVLNMVLGVENDTSALYFWSYLVLEILKCGFSVFAVRELLSLTFDRYPGIRSLGRWVMYAGVALSTSSSLVLTRIFWANSATGRAHSHLFYVQVGQRMLVFSLALVIVAVLVFLSKYPLDLGRNTMVSCFFFSVLFLSEAAQLLIDTFFPLLYFRNVDYAESAFITFCLLGWAFMLKPEPVHTPTTVKFATPDEEHLLSQLNALNQMMTRSVQR